jgi:CRISPR-associated protein Cas2
MKKRMVLIIYDISDNKIRTKFVKFIEHYGQRVQKSAFEAFIDSSKYKKMIRIIPKIIKDNDNVRVYMLDGEIKYWGENENKVQEEVIIL